MTSSIVIPQDIIDSIIKVVGYDRHLLKTCALVSSSFLFPSRKRLFSTIFINLEHAKACQSLLQVLVDNPTIQSFVRRITIDWGSNPKRLESNFRLNGILIAILQLSFCCLDGFRINNWDSGSKPNDELKDAISTFLIHSSTLKFLDLYQVNVPITFFQGIRLTKLQLNSISPIIFDREQSRLLTLAEARIPMASQMVIDQCVWRFYYEPVYGTSVFYFYFILSNPLVFVVQLVYRSH